jgi:IclR family transcriptional regulator, acetate operon repressor
MSNQESDKGGVQLVARVAAILRSLESEPAGLSLGAIAQRSGLPRSTVQRLVEALVQESLLEVQGRGGICLGPAFMRLAAHSHVDITQKARPLLEELSRVTEETTVLLGLSGTELMIFHSVQSSHALRVAPIAGKFLSVHATAGGKILLSRMSDEAVVELLGPNLKQFTDKTLDLPGLLADLARIRSTGFACDFDEHTLGVGAIAVGLQTPQGHYAIDVVGPVWRMEQSIDAIKQALLECRNNLLGAMRSIGS